MAAINMIEKVLPLLQVRVVHFNKLGTAKVGAISKAQKARSFEICKKVDLLGF